MLTIFHPYLSLRTQGDSLKCIRGGALTKFYGTLKKWLTASYRESFTVKGRLFPIGTQEDTNSCGICVANSMAHVMLDDTLFTPERHDIVRMETFVRLVDFLLTKVS